MKKSPLKYWSRHRMQTGNESRGYSSGTRPPAFGMSHTQIKKNRKLHGTTSGVSRQEERRLAMEERLQANNPEAPQNQPAGPSLEGTQFVNEVQDPAGVSNQSNDVGYNTGANYIEQQDMMLGLGAMHSGGGANSNVRTSTRRIGGVDIGGEDYGGYEIGEYQQKNGGMAGRASRMNSIEGLYGNEESRQASVGLGEVPAAFRGGPNENIDDRQNQFNNLLFNPNVKSDQGLNEQYESFYNTQGIV
jgi:hypothetical protein